MHRSTFPSARIRVLLCAVLLQAAMHGHAQIVQVDIPTNAPRYVPLAPGGSARFAFTVTNRTLVAVDGAVGGELQVPSATFAEYAFAADEPSLCGPPVLVPRTSFTEIRFPIAALGPGGARTCAYTVQRAPGSAGDLGFRACWQADANSDPFCLARARLGTLPDLELALDTLGAGTGDTTVVRLRLYGRSPLAVGSRVASTGCHEFAGGFLQPTQFDVDGNLPGGCASAVGTFCIGGTGEAPLSRAFRIGPAPAGGSATCLLRIRRLRSEGVAQVPLFLSGDRVDLPGGAVAFDPVRERETVSVGLGLPGAVPVPLGPAAPVAIGLAILLAGLYAQRRRGRAQSA